MILPVSDAIFTIDRNSVHRRSGEITVEMLATVPPTTASFGGVTVPILPLTPTSPLAPFGQEVKVEITIIAPSKQGGAIGDNGWVPLGTYAIAESTIDDTSVDLTTTLQVFDRSWVFAQWEFLNHYTVPAADGTLEGEVKALLASVWNNNGPGRFGTPVPDYISTAANFAGGNAWTCPAGVYNQGEDPWSACLDMAYSAGNQLFFDVNGVLISKPVPGSPSAGDMNNLPVSWNFSPGEVSTIGTYAHPVTGTPFTTPVGVKLAMNRKIKNDFFVTATGPNNAKGSSSGSTAPKRARATDSNPQSAGFVNGPLGDLPQFISDGLITTTAQALAEAQFGLAQSLSTAWTVAVAHSLHPLFEVDDVCTITNPRLSLNLQKFITDTITTTVRYDGHTVIGGRMISNGA